MYCAKCGVRLADSEKACPLCGTAAYHPDLPPVEGSPLYPAGKMPRRKSGHKILCGAVIGLFLIPLAVCLLADLTLDGRLEWFGYVAGALAVAYVTFALPAWFEKPHPIVFVPCDFAAVAAYLWLVNWLAGGDWYWTFALPLTVGIGLIVCAAVTLFCCLRRGKLYVSGGTFMALGAFMPCIEWLMGMTFGLAYIGWSLYPLAVLMLCGGLLIYLAIDSRVREIVERKVFF